MNSAFKPKIIDYISGIFILFTIIGFVYVLYFSYTKNVKKKYDFYYTFFDSSYGVSENAFIYYLEIPIGTIKTIEFNNTDKVKITFGIENKYNNLVTKDSKIEVLSSLGVGSILNGKGLQLKRSISKEVISPDSFIPSVTPKSITDIIEQFELDKLSVSFKSIIYNIDKLLIALNKEDGDLMGTLKNVNKITQQAVDNNIPLSIVNLSNNVQLNTDLIIKDLSNSISLLDDVMTTTNTKIDELNVNKVNDILDSIEKSAIELNGIVTVSKTTIINNKDKINNIILRTDNITKKINELNIFTKDNNKIQSLDIK